MHLGRLALAYRAALQARLDAQGSFQEWGLRPPSIGTLKVIDALAPVSQREVGERLGVHPSDMVRVVDQLEEYELVSRVRTATDRRRYDLTITDKGRDVLDHWSVIAEEVDADFYGVLSETEQRQLEKLLAKLAQHHFPPAERRSG
jgi:DNA-binding MarR family transcriptional regulator